MASRELAAGRRILRVVRRLSSRPRSRSWRRAGLAIGLAAVGLASSGCANAASPAHASLERRIIEIAERVKPSVVHIESIVRVNDRRSQVSGSGFVVSEDGRILTNHHVVERAEKVTVTVPGRKKKYPAEVIGTDKQTDIALLRIDADPPIPAATFGSSEALEVGQWVLAIGNPYGLDGTVSLGIVSAKGRNLEIPDLLNDFIQTDAMIDRGSSGGPLVDLEGRVVGVNSRGQGRGIGFTIPVETALSVMRQLEGGGVERGYLGVTVQALDRDLADYFGVPSATGAIVNGVIEDSPAEAAGLRTGDLLVAFAGTSIEAEKDEDLAVFQRQVAATAPGDSVRLTILREGEPLDVQVTLGAQPTVEPAEEESDLGFLVQEVSPRLARHHRLASDTGAFVYFVAGGSPAREAGLRIGDVIERIEDTAIGDLDDFRAAMASVADRSRFLVTVRRSEASVFVLIQRRSSAESTAGSE